MVNTSSLAGLTPSPRNAAIYATAKAGLVAMSESIREELAEHGIGVSVLCAGPFRTNIREAGKNRQARYRHHSGYSSEESKLAERESPPAWADPLDAGRLVVDGILNDRLYLVTHGEYRGWAEGRFEEILAAYPEPKDPELAARAGRKRPANAYG